MTPTVSVTVERLRLLEAAEKCADARAAVGRALIDGDPSGDYFAELWEADDAAWRVYERLKAGA